MSLTQVVLVIVLVLCTQGTNAQFPFGPGGGFFQEMMNNIQGMGQNMAYMAQTNYARARAAGRNAGPGRRRFFDDGNTRGSTYSSPDGSFSSFSFSSGGPGASGYEFYSGPDGAYERQF